MVFEDFNKENYGALSPGCILCDMEEVVSSGYNSMAAQAGVEVGLCKHGYGGKLKKKYDKTLCEGIGERCCNDVIKYNADGECIVNEVVEDLMTDMQEKWEEDKEEAESRGETPPPDLEWNDRLTIISAKCAEAGNQRHCEGKLESNPEQSNFMKENCEWSTGLVDDGISLLEDSLNTGGEVVTQSPVCIGNSEECICPEEDSPSEVTMYGSARLSPEELKTLPQAGDDLGDWWERNWAEHEPSPISLTELPMELLDDFIAGPNPEDYYVQEDGQHTKKIDQDIEACIATKECISQKTGITSGEQYVNEAPDCKGIIGWSPCTSLCEKKEDRVWFSCPVPCNPSGECKEPDESIDTGCKNVFSSPPRDDSQTWEEQCLEAGCEYIEPQKEWSGNCANWQQSRDGGITYYSWNDAVQKMKLINPGSGEPIHPQFRTEPVDCKPIHIGKDGSMTCNDSYGWGNNCLGIKEGLSCAFGLTTISDAKVNNQLYCGEHGRCRLRDNGVPFCDCYPGWYGKNCTCSDMMDDAGPEEVGIPDDFYIRGGALKDVYTEIATGSKALKCLYNELGIDDPKKTLAKKIYECIDPKHGPIEYGGDAKGACCSEENLKSYINELKCYKPYCNDSNDNFNCPGNTCISIVPEDIDEEIRTAERIQETISESCDIDGRRYMDELLCSKTEYFEHPYCINFREIGIGLIDGPPPPSRQAMPITPPESLDSEIPIQPSPPKNNDRIIVTIIACGILMIIGIFQFRRHIKIKQLR